jgi:hypothetical protein
VGADELSGTLHGFLLRAGTFTPIDVPGANVIGTQARGINAQGTIVGAFADNTGAQHGFVATR